MSSRPSKTVMPFIMQLHDLIEEAFLGNFSVWTGHGDGPRFVAYDSRMPNKVFMFWIRFKKHLDANETVNKSIALDHGAICRVMIKVHGHMTDDPLIQINEYEMRLKDGPETFVGIMDQIYESAY